MGGTYLNCQIAGGSKDGDGKAGVIHAPQHDNDHTACLARVLCQVEQLKGTKDHKDEAGRNREADWDRKALINDVYEIVETVMDLGQLETDAIQLTGRVVLLAEKVPGRQRKTQKVSQGDALNKMLVTSPGHSW